ncbi:MAG TPA: 2-oxo acid dehydrogenase subunit E2, partial [Myxococcota bacterium]|nr:2-oxo acid dehydrogenase subunit E2 [Myxococcota bacterium]
MSISVELPALGESVLEGTVSKWLVKEGDRVEQDQPIVEVTTDKVDAEIPAPQAGVIEAIVAGEGDVVPVGGVLARIATGAAAAAPSPKPAQPAAAAAPKPAVAPAPAPAAEAPKPPLAPATPPAAAAATARGPERPAFRADFGHYAIQEGDKVIPMSPLRKLVAEHMVYSKLTSPHVGTVAEVDMGGVTAVRAKAKDRFAEAHGMPLTFLPFIVAAAVRALREHPQLNASVVGDAIVEKKDVSVGIAVETERGLVVPVVRHAD